MKDELEKRGLQGAGRHVRPATRSTSRAFKSYHTTTPNGYNLQISDVTHDTRLTLPDGGDAEARRRVVGLIRAGSACWRRESLSAPRLSARS